MVGSDFNRRSPNDSDVHWNNWVGAESSHIFDPIRNVSQRLMNAFQVSSSTPTSITGRLSFGPLDAELLSVDLKEGRDELRGQVFRLVVAALGGTLDYHHRGVDLL